MCKLGRVLDTSQEVFLKRVMAVSPHYMPVDCGALPCLRSVSSSHCLKYTKRHHIKAFLAGGSSPYSLRTSNSQLIYILEWSAQPGINICAHLLFFLRHVRLNMLISKFLGVGAVYDRQVSSCSTYSSDAARKRTTPGLYEVARVCLNIQCEKPNILSSAVKLQHSGSTRDGASPELSLVHCVGARIIERTVEQSVGHKRLS